MSSPRALLVIALGLLGPGPAAAAEWSLVWQRNLDIAATSRGLAYGLGQLFFTGTENARIYRIDPLTGRTLSSFATPRKVGALAWDRQNSILLAATYDSDPPSLFELDLAGNLISDRPLVTDPGDRNPTLIDGLELHGSDLYYSCDLGTQVYVAERATLAVTRRFPVGDGSLSGHTKGGDCLFTGTLDGTDYRLVRSDLVGNVLASENTGVIGGGASNEFPPEDLAFDADNFAVPVVWVNIPWIPGFRNPLWAVEVNGCGETCTSPPPPVDAGNSLRGVRVASEAAYSWRSVGALWWHVVADGLRAPVQIVEDVSSSSWGIAIDAPPRPVTYLKVRAFNCLGEEGP